MASFSSVCGQIGVANIATYNGGISLYAIQWQSAPPNSQVLLVQYKLTGDPTWLNASTNLPVDIYGNIQNGRFEILSNPVLGSSYDVKVVPQCGGVPYETTFVVEPLLYSDNYVIDNALYNICGNDSVLLYSDVEFAPGAIMYTDAQLSAPLTGYSYIADVNTGIIYNLNPANGTVLTVTIYECRASTSGLYILGNNSGTICAGTIVTLYSDGVPTVGSVLYSDIALSVPVTGNDYVLFLLDNLIYNLNTGTGVIGAVTGVTCSANGNIYYYAPVLSDIPDAVPTKLYTPGSFGKGAIMYTDYAMTTALTGNNYISLNGETRTISTTTGEVGCLAVNC